jgi:hypothetical protein
MEPTHVRAYATRNHLSTDYADLRRFFFDEPLKSKSKPIGENLRNLWTNVSS